MLEIGKILLKDQLDCYRLQRHDFLNHWQVIMGYLQLNHADKAFEYARNALKGIEIEQKASQIAHTEVLAVLLGWIIQLRKEQISLELIFPDSMKEEAFWVELWQEEYTKVFYGYTKECLNLLKEKTEIICGTDSGLVKGKITLTYSNNGFDFGFILSQNENSIFIHNLELK